MKSAKQLSGFLSSKLSAGYSHVAVSSGFQMRIDRMTGDPGISPLRKDWLSWGGVGRLGKRELRRVLVILFKDVNK